MTFEIFLSRQAKSFILTVISFGHITKLSDRKETPLKEHFQTLEKLRSQNFKVEIETLSRIALRNKKAKIKHMEH